MTGPLVPELRVADAAAARDWLVATLGFRIDQEALRLGDQRLLAAGGAGPGVVDHVALAVPDVSQALAEAIARGGALGPSTLNGPLGIDEFRGQGVDYAFLAGPERAPVEIISCRDPARRHGPGHDHVGIACAALGPMRAFFASLGFVEEEKHGLVRPDGLTEVSFMTLGGSVVEIYSTPLARTATALRPPGRWALRLAGLDAARRGPEGIEVLPL